MNDATNFETGTTSFLDRQALTRRFEENLETLLEDAGFKMLPWGHPVILQDNTWIKSRLRRLDSKSSLAAIAVKFSPDYIVINEKNPDIFFYADAKASITPVFFQVQINRIKDNFGKDGNLSREHIGEIEREAWFSYNKFYPPNSVAIIIAAPYNENLILAEWVNNISCMWCLKKPQAGNPIPWNCKQCPLFLRDDEGFGVVFNEFAGGSGTPHTNIHLGTLRTLDAFLNEEFGNEINSELYGAFLDFVKQWPLNKPAGRVSWGQYNSAIKQLRHTCPWLRCRIKDEFIPCSGEKQKKMF